MPPAAPPLTVRDLLHGLAGAFKGARCSRRLENELREYFEVKHVFLVSSGKAALTLILLALKRLSTRPDVVLPAYTCFSVPAAVVRADLSVSLADVAPETLDFDYGSLAESVGVRTLAVVAQHLFGIPCDIDRVQELCRQTGAFLIEDAAQAMGGRYKGRMLGSLGDVGFFSLGRGKHLTAGAGGIIVTDSDRIAAAVVAEYDTLGRAGLTTALADFVRLALMSLFIRPRLYWLPAGLPFLRLGETRFELQFPLRRMSAMSAGTLTRWRDRLTEANRLRVAAAEYFAVRLGSPRLHPAGIPFLRFPVLTGSREARDHLYALSQQHGMGVGRMYPAPINEIPELHARFPSGAYPSAKLLADRLLTLPTHHLATPADRRRVGDLLEHDAEDRRALAAPTTDAFSRGRGERWS